jgi:uncharacterized repeat protein (TIGR01451 family)
MIRTSASRSRSASTGSRWSRWRRLVAPIVALTLALGFLSAAPAQAAGSGVLSITPTIAHPATGATLSVIDPADSSLGGKYAVNFAFTCNTAACDSTVVTVAPNPRDPYYNQFVLESAGYSFTPPFPGATATGSPAAGITVNLGNLAVGTSGVFTIYYTFYNRPGLPAPGSPGSFFPNGWVVPASATISSPTAVAPVTNSTSATWVSRTGTPTHVLSGPASVRTDTQATISLGSYTACNYVSTYNLGVEIYQCAKSWSASVALPPDAQYVAGSGGTYDPVTHTVSWAAANTTTATTTARGPLGLSFKVTFPSTGMPTTGAACVATETFTSNVTYVLLDGTVQTAPTRTANVQAQNCAPFSGMTTPVKAVALNAGTAAAPIVYIPAAGQPANSRYWTVTAGNTANVAGVATITDTTLDLPDMPVNRIYNPGPTALTVDYTVKDAGGTTTVITGAALAVGATIYAPAGTRFASVIATSAPLAGPNVVSTSQTAHTDASISFYFSVAPGSTPGTRTNTAQVTMSYPGYSLAPLTGTASRTVTLQNAPVTPPQLQVDASGPYVSGNIIAGSVVTWAMRGQVVSAPNNNSIIPQYVYIAPKGWNITSTAWGTAPPVGTTVVQRQVIIGGIVYNAVVATWPAPLNIPIGGSSGALPVLNIVTTPTSAAAAGVNTTSFFMGDANHGVATYSPNTYTETTDLTGDGTADDKYAARYLNASVTGTPALAVLKEICRPDATAPDGCVWIANSNALVGVPPGASSIKYRVTITNTGSAQANNVVAYDVLPYIGDSGTTNATAGTPRGSTVVETLNSVSGVPGDVTLAYSTSTNPPRPGVYSGTTTGDWLAPPAGASALRATITALPSGASRTFIYDAALVGGTADKIACNSVAAIANSLDPVEPAAVCATTQEADLSVAGGSRFPLQVGRVGTVPFLVNNGGGSQLATGTVTIDVPAGLTIESLTIAYWYCTAPGMTGPVTVTCDPVDGAGDTRQLQRDVAETIPLRVTPSAAVNGDELCFDASIAGIMNDPVSANNDTTVCSTVFDAAELLSVTKTDGVTVANVGDTLTYTITARNVIVDRGLVGVVVTDELPEGVEWVSGGTVSGQDADGLGGTVTFPATDLAAAGASTATGDSGSGNPGSSATFTVTVRVTPGATGDIVNTATATATDPVTTSPLTATATDTDGLRRLTVTKASSAAAAGVRTGATVTYTVTLTNDGTSAYPVGSPARVLDDLSGVLDDATYVSGTVSVNGGAPTPIAPNGAQDLVWSGALDAGASVVIVYSVTVGAGADKVLTNSAFASGQPGGTCTNGQDADGVSCATVQSIFAPLIGKRIQSFVQNDDGTWTIVYAIDVTNPSPIGTSTYDLTDTLRFGTGLQVLSASATVPAGVTAASPAWSGSGAIANGVGIAGGAQQTYTVTVTADAHQVAGTAAAVCVAGATGGFANQATIELAGIADTSAQACATPVAPTITKTVGAATQQADGSWNVVYTITVRNSNAAPADLAYTIDDELDFPAGTSVNTVQVAGPGANSSFDGTSDPALLSGVGRIPVPTGSQTSTTRVYAVTVNVDAPVGAVSAADLLCTPDGGYANDAELLSGTGTTVVGTASACADITVAPLPEITKSVVSTSVDGDGDWTVVYQIDVRNPDGTFGTFYDLDDELDFGAGASVVSATLAAPAAVTPDPAWDGVGTTEIVQDVALAAGQTHSYQVTVVADPGTLDTESADADCRVDTGETGTGFRNVATVTAGVSTAFDDACEPFNDPSVVKTTVAAPTQDPGTGIWTLSYRLTVTNRSTAVDVPYSVADALGFPADVTIVDVAASGPAGVTLNPAFDGTSDTDLASSTIAAAVDDATPTTDVYTVTVQFTVPAGITSATECDPAQGAGGLRNETELTVGARITGSVACADVPDVPLPTLDKTVLSQVQQADGTWLVLYRIVVANPSGTAASEYTLDDAFALGDGIVLDAAPTVVAQPLGVTVEPDWNGSDATTIAEDILLPAAGSHTYTVRAVIDAGAVTGDEPAGDCVLDAGETGTGFGNTATIGTDVATADAEVCAQAWDPGVTKEIAGLPAQQADGSWLLSYTITVSNPSAVALSYGLVDELDFPTGTVVTVESAAGRSGSPTVEGDWNGETNLQLVADGTPLPPNAIHVFDVTVRAVLPEDQGSQAGGWANSATVESGVGGAVTDEAEELADILIPELSVTKTATPSAAVLRIGDTVDYRIEIENVGDGDYTSLYPAVVWDALVEVLDDADLTSGPVATPAAGSLASDPSGFHWSGELGSGATLTLDYTVTITGGGNADLVNVAFVSAGSETPDAPTPADCADPLCATTTTALPALEVTKSVDQTTVAPGGVVEYTVTVTNTGGVDIPDADPAVVTDTLDDVLDDAVYNGDAVSDVGSVVFGAGVLTWTGGLAVGETATMSYSVTVHSTADSGAKLVNVAVSDPTLPTLGVDGSAAGPEATTTSTVQRMADTGLDTVWISLLLALLLLSGGVLVLVVLGRRREREAR